MKFRITLGMGYIMGLQKYLILLVTMFHRTLLQSQPCDIKVGNSVHLYMPGDVIIGGMSMGNLTLLSNRDLIQHSGKKFMKEGRGYTLNGMCSKTYIESR